MAGNGIQFLFVLVSVQALVRVSSARGAAQKCAWNEYSDDNMNDCGPCSEICTGVVHPHISPLGTEEQCRNECSGYLDSLKCTNDEYYDDMVYSCAPCSEICDHHEITKTTRDCSSQCKKYLPTMAKRCTNKQYFVQEAMKCAKCSDLCSINKEQNVTDPDCFVNCHSYLEQYYPLILWEHLRLPGNPGTVAAPTVKSNLHPGTITSIAIGVVCIVAALGFAVYWFHLRPQKYARTPNNDDEAGPRNADESVEAVLNESQAQPQDISFGMKDLGTSIQVSSEVIPQQTTTEEEAHKVDEQRLGMPEMDLFAPSSAASGLVMNRES
ncbi:uncharacterized protein [Littorina saxatilis]|uniref:Uncharacterized protein n=1 Tax=Littorina saxatilis TaxID=31220 RepID=A0AAN9BY98_9CAEN